MLSWFSLPFFPLENFLLLKDSMLFATLPFSYPYEWRKPEFSSTAWKKGGYILGLELTDPFATDL